MHVLDVLLMHVNGLTWTIYLDFPVIKLHEYMHWITYFVSLYELGLFESLWGWIYLF